MSKAADRPQLHWSKVTSLLLCGEAFRRSDLMGEYLSPNVPSIGGRGVHKANQKDFETKIATGSLLGLGDVSDITRDAINEIWDLEGARLLPDEATVGAKEVRGRTIDESIRLVSAYHTNVAPTVAPLRVERPWVICMPKHKYDLAGQIDLEEQPNPEIPAGRIRDWKTRKASPRPWFAERSLQLSVYAMAKRVLDEDIPAVGLDFIINLKREVKLDSQFSIRTERHFRTVLNHLELVIDCLEKGVFMRAHPDHWKCTPEYCGYWDSCKYTHHY